MTPTELFCANAGDSRTVACQGGEAVELSEDHNLRDPFECKRVIEAGGFCSGGRVNGYLAVSRGFGDFECKREFPDAGLEWYKKFHQVTCVPDVKVVKRSDTSFVVLACDGIWDCLSSDKVIDFYASQMKAVDSV